eukprot:scaffold13637_cov112-Isochrysis_galbana.AAC.8
MGEDPTGGRTKHKLGVATAAAEATTAQLGFHDELSAHRNVLRILTDELVLLDAIIGSNGGERGLRNTRARVQEHPARVGDGDGKPSHLLVELDREPRLVVVHVPRERKATHCLIALYRARRSGRSSGDAAGGWAPGSSSIADDTVVQRDEKVHCERGAAVVAVIGEGVRHVARTPMRPHKE